MNELKYTAKDIDNLIAEEKSFKGEDWQFLESKCEPIIEIPRITKSDEEWENNWNRGSRKLRETGQQCTCCGRPVNDRVMYHRVLGSNYMANKKDTIIISLFDDGDMYQYPIGSVCAKKLTKEILKPLGLKPRDYFYGVDYTAKYENDPEYLGIAQLPEKYWAKHL
nr:hypothetical protein [uncultured Mediterranean phage uvMED]BAR29182.1 hypothetical protein [uncultured Mediterranean phage uvMED]|tara:strand:+ start:2466 stop:2963 length:498 start_codon:yes stop_codon:yes gene_type:complete